MYGLLTKCEVKIAGYIGQVLFLRFMNRDGVAVRDGVKVHKLAKKEQGQYSAILTKKAWSIKDLLFGVWGNFSPGTQHVVSQAGKITPSCLLG